MQFKVVPVTTKTYQPKYPNWETNWTTVQGQVGGSVGWASTSGEGHDLRGLESSPQSGSLPRSEFSLLLPLLAIPPPWALYLSDKHIKSLNN